MEQRAVLVLSETPDSERAVEIAQSVAHQYSDDTQTAIVWSLNLEPPEWLDISTADQLSAHKRDAGNDACYMVVILCTDEEADLIYHEE